LLGEKISKTYAGSDKIKNQNFFLVLQKKGGCCQEHLYFGLEFQYVKSITCGDWEKLFSHVIYGQKKILEKWLWFEILKSCKRTRIKFSKTND